METKNFSEVMDLIFDIVYEEMGAGHPILETIIYWFADSSVLTNSYIYNEMGMFHLLRNCMNWDLFWIS